jgi:glyoxylase-like metal-dependent hydrolase (beta-lactamase superfamily II)
MKLSDHCYAVTGLGYVQPWCVNAGFVVGSELTLVVDAGGNRLAAQSIHGYASAVRPENRQQVINTEKHFDHIGGNGYFRELGIDVWGHAGIARTVNEFQDEMAEFNEAILYPVRRARREERAFFHQTSLVNPNCPIQTESIFDLGNLSVEILLTPGHTPTNLSVWVPEDGVLYAGDCIIREYLPNLDAGTKADWQLWLASLDRIEHLEPKFIVGGHGPVSQGDEIPVAVESVRKVLIESIKQGFSPTSSHQA